MRQILWFRRDLRVEDSALLHHAKGEVLPIFIFDTNILSKLDKADKRVTFIYQSVMKLKSKLKSIGLDLAMFYGDPVEIFKNLKNFDEVLCSIDFDAYAINRDKQVEKILPLRRFIDSFILDPQEHLKKDATPYKMFTAFYKSLYPIWQSKHIEEFSLSKDVKLCNFDYSFTPSYTDIGFEKQNLPAFLELPATKILNIFVENITNYGINRDYFNTDKTSNLSIYLRFGLISPKQVFNYIKSLHVDEQEKDTFIRQIFWREFYNYLLYHFPKSEFENFNPLHVEWEDDKKIFDLWCKGQTAVPIIDAAMRHLNSTGMMHNRLRMIVSSFLTKNLLIDWRWGERYFAEKLLDYEASSNIGSWQWAASTGADCVPYFRIFNPYLQSKKFDKEGIFIKSILPKLKNVDSKLLHVENPKAIVSISSSRKRAIEAFKKSKI